MFFALLFDIFSLFSFQGAFLRFAQIRNSQFVIIHLSSAFLLNLDEFGLFFVSYAYLYTLRTKKVQIRQIWWAQVDSNHRPHAYQACALTT